MIISVYEEAFSIKVNTLIFFGVMRQPNRLINPEFERNHFHKIR